MVMYQIESVTKRKNKKKIAIIIIIAILFVMLSIFSAIQLANYLHNKENIAQNENQTEGTTLAEGDKVSQSEEQKDKENNNAEEQTEKQNIGSLTKEQINAINHIYSSDDKRAFLTFDDGPSYSVTTKIIDILKEENIKATFFVLGTMVKSNPEVLKREYEEGHYIANHGYSHVYKNVYKNENAPLEEYKKTNKLIQDALGNPNYQSNVFRFPGGSIGGYYDDIKKKAKKVFDQNNIAYLDWNVLTNDADGADTREEIMENLKNTCGNQSSVVILMHDAPNKDLTAETLPDVISYLKKQGYTFCSLYDIL